MLLPGRPVSLKRTYQVMGQVVSGSSPEASLISANTINLPPDIPEAEITARPLAECSYTLFSSLASPASRSVYIDQRRQGGSMGIHGLGFHPINFN